MKRLLAVFVFLMILFWPVTISLSRLEIVKLDSNQWGYLITGWLMAFAILFAGSSVTSNTDH